MRYQDLTRVRQILRKVGLCRNLRERCLGFQLSEGQQALVCVKLVTLVIYS